MRVPYTRSVKLSGSSLALLSWRSALEFLIISLAGRIDYGHRCNRCLRAHDRQGRQAQRHAPPHHLSFCSGRQSFWGPAVRGRWLPCALFSENRKKMEEIRIVIYRKPTETNIIDYTKRTERTDDASRAYEKHRQTLCGCGVYWSCFSLLCFWKVAVVVWLLFFIYEGSRDIPNFCGNFSFCLTCRHNPFIARIEHLSCRR